MVDALGLALDLEQSDLGFWYRNMTGLAWGFLGATEYEASARLERMAEQQEELDFEAQS